MYEPETTLVARPGFTDSKQSRKKDRASSLATGGSLESGVSVMTCSVLRGACGAKWHTGKADHLKMLGRRVCVLCWADPKQMYCVARKCFTKRSALIGRKHSKYTKRNALIRECSNIQNGALIGSERLNNLVVQLQ